ncbi:MAG: hypothetical protein F4050_06900, partial [Rhodospirillaceae bacterium]|nr:hypothetical protein [Rhodospirillaceae bacterium]
MSKIEHVIVAVQDDFIERQTRARPVTALAELIWNSLDGDANRVNVEFERNDLAGGLSRIVVYDDGDGFARDEAANLFGNLGGSWKIQTHRTKSKSRMVHGQEGRGRYKAFALGRSVEWKVSYVDETAQIKTFDITLLESNLKDVAISEERKSGNKNSGVIVNISDIKKDFRVFFSEDGLQELTETFALYLMNYKDVSIQIGQHLLDPDTATVNQVEFELSSIKDDEGNEYSVNLHVIEWNLETKRTLYLCSESGFPLDQVETRFHVPGFAFSAYL